jgi:hypothetical protein
VTYYLLKAGGLLGGTFPWSFGSVGFSAGAESSVATTWDAAILALWQDATLAPFMPATTTLTYTSASTASPEFKQTTKTTLDHSIAGGSSSDAVGWRTCIIVTWRSILSTRYGRGRWYMPGPATNALAATGYELSAAASTAVSDAVSAFSGALGGAITLQILHRKGSLDGAATPLSLSPVTSADTPNTFGSQRRRADKIVPTRTVISV